MAVTTTHTASWGVNDAHSKDNMVCLSWNENVEPVMAPEHNEKGSVIGQAVYDVRHTVRAVFNVSASVATGVVAADTVAELLASTYGASGYYITNLEEVESNNDYMKVNVGLERYEHCTTGFNGTT